MIDGASQRPLPTPCAPSLSVTSVGTSSVGTSWTTGASEGEAHSPRDSSRADVTFHQLSASAVVFFVFEGLLRQSLTLSSDEEDLTNHLLMLALPCVWLVVNSLPMWMALAYAYLPHSHRLHCTVVRLSWRTHALLISVAAAVTLHISVAAAVTPKKHY